MECTKPKAQRGPLPAVPPRLTLRLPRHTLPPAAQAPPARRRRLNPIDWAPLVADLLGAPGWLATWPRVVALLPGHFEHLRVSRYGGDQAARGSLLLRELAVALRAALAAAEAAGGPPPSPLTRQILEALDLPGYGTPVNRIARLLTAIHPETHGPTAGGEGGKQVLSPPPAHMLSTKAGATSVLCCGAVALPAAATLLPLSDLTPKQCDRDAAE